MQHECPRVLAFQRVDALLIVGRSQRHHRQALCFASGKQRGTMRAGQDPDFTGDRPNLKSSPPMSIPKGGMRCLQPAKSPRPESGADDDADCEIQHVAPHCECLEFFQHESS